MIHMNKGDQPCEKTSDMPDKPPCDCGNPEASWHGDPYGRRKYCCDKCLARELNVTPRTNERTLLAGDIAPEQTVVHASFAGQLEREVARLKWELLDNRNKLNAAQAEIDQLKAELRENASSCSQTNLEIEWCRSCTSKRWCVNGMKLLEASDGEQKTSKTPRTDKNEMLSNLLPADGGCFIVKSGVARQLETELAEALDASAARARIINKQTLELAGLRADIERKDKLIEQMRNALEWALTEARSTHGENLIKAALAAEKSGQ